ncbi:MAG TPA: helix-turn-helix domain-containing protein [bacterium]|nr:helix-turn-helix domain-containing protein [bacterium]
MRPADGFCPYFQRAAELIGRRWTGAVLRAMLAGPLRFSQLERAVPAISARALVQRLRELGEAGLIERSVETGTPIHVTYTLTEKGRSLEDAVKHLEHWAHHWLVPHGIDPHRHLAGKVRAAARSGEGGHISVPARRGRPGRTG